MAPTGDVAIACGGGYYPQVSPYHPTVAYPEYPFRAVSRAIHANHAYAHVREVLHLLELDSENYGSPNWNPLGDMVFPGNTVVLKPNFIRHFRDTRAGHDDCLITHGAVIRAVLDYVYIALRGGGRIIIADAPQNDADFATIRRIAGLAEIQQFYKRCARFGLEVLDLRPEYARKVSGIITGHCALAGDPAGYVKVNLGKQSAFMEISHLCHLFYGSEYDTDELRSHHHDDVHEYLVSKTMLDADCVINLPKLKTHKKTGVTAALKNVVGINGNKNWLPHHREGTPAQGGDQFAGDGLWYRLEHSMVRQFKRIFPRLGPLCCPLARPAKLLGKWLFGDSLSGTIRSGNWHGNDTTWRMVVDLNRILMYVDADGVLHDRLVRRLFSVVDAVVAGEGNGPLDPIPRRVGMVIAGTNPATVDLTCTRLMGFDYNKAPMICRAFESHAYPIAEVGVADIRCLSNRPSFCGPAHCLHPIRPPFIPPRGWQGMLELGNNNGRSAPCDSVALPRHARD